MDIRKIKKLIELLEESNLTEIEIVEGEESVHLIRGVQMQAAPVALPQAVVQQGPAAPGIATAAEDQEEQIPEGELVLSPMVGPFTALQDQKPSPM